MQRRLRAALLSVALLAAGAQRLANAEPIRYEPQVVTVHGKLLSAPGATPDGKKLTFPAIQLDSPITVEGDQESPTERGVVLMHLVLNPRMMESFKSLKGQPATITGSLFHADNGNHQTNVLMTPAQIRPAK